MKRFSSLSFSTATSIALVLAWSVVALLSGCGKEVSLGSSSTGSSESSDGGPSLSPVSCAPEKTVRWRFVQPQPRVNRSVDLLFVVDTSDSLAAERSRIAATIPAFVQALPASTDYRIGVMLAHGGASPYSGRLYAGAGSPKVLNSRSSSLADIQAKLQATLARRVADVDEADGEMMMYSASRSLDADRLAEAQSLGMFRPNAALSIIFVSDENDICWRPELHGFTSFPDYVPSYQNSEVVAYDRYCAGVEAAGVLSSFRALKGGQPLFFGAITHVNPTSVPRSSEKAIGHGLLELVRASIDGELIDIGESSYSQGLARLGSAISTSLELDTIFKLASAAGIKADTVRAYVDSRLVPAYYRDSASSVQIAAGDAGKAGSIVEITACRE